MLSLCKKMFRFYFAIGDIVEEEEFTFFFEIWEAVVSICVQSNAVTGFDQFVDGIVVEIFAGGFDIKLFAIGFFSSIKSFWAEVPSWWHR